MPAASSLNIRSWMIASTLLGLLVPSLWLWTQLRAPDEGVRIRSSLSFDIGTAKDFDWQPDRWPAGFLRNSGGVPPLFAAVASRIQSGEIARPDNLQLALGIARHLMSPGPRLESPIRSNITDSYKGIVDARRGYCADFAKVFNGIAVAAALPVRQWGFSFEAFGSGHTFNEIYDVARRKWIMVDSFHSLYFVDRNSGEPLSVIELHDRLLGDDASGTLAIVRIVPERFPFRSDSLALDYYRRGMPQLYMVWGNNVFDYERTRGYRWLGWLSRSAEELLAIVSGHYATMRVYPVGVSDRDVDELFARRSQLLTALCAWLVSAIVFVPLLYRLLRSRRRADMTVYDAKL